MLLKLFKNHLLNKKNKPSNITIKNYLCDVNKFISWYEENTASKFNPKKITIDSISLYKTSLIKRQSSQVSIDRYLSSLRAFFTFLMSKNLIQENPLLQEVTVTHTSSDPLLLNDFRLFLISNKLSKISIKNYIMDVTQFLEWFDQVGHNSHDASNKIEILKNIEPFIIDEYKNRLYSGPGFSAASINRKLSSLRRYLSWISKKNITIVSFPHKKISQSSFIENQSQINQKINENEVHTTITPEPILNEKPIKIWEKVSDLLIVLPFLAIINKIKYFIWVIQGRNIFKIPAPKITGNPINSNKHQ